MSDPTEESLKYTVIIVKLDIYAMMMKLQLIEVPIAAVAEQVVVVVIV